MKPKQKNPVIPSSPRHLVLFLLLVFASTAADAGNGRIIRFPEPISDRYIVILEKAVPRETVPALAEQLAGQHGGRVRFIINNVVNMFTVEMTDAQATALASHPLVMQVEEVAKVHLSEIQTLPPPEPLNWMVLWNLDRIDQWGTADSNQFQFCERARNVIAYVPDTGVMRNHQEFIDPEMGGSRVRLGVCFASDCGAGGGDACPNADGTTSHGTAVASILGGVTVGVAKRVSIVPIRVIGCDRTSNTEHLNWGLDWIRNADPNTGNPDRNRRPALVSMSTYVRTNDPLIASFESVINGLVLDEYSPPGCTPGTPGCTLVWSGIPVVVSANNQAQDQRLLPPAQIQTSPARMAYRNDPSVAQPGFASPGRAISAGGSGRRVIDGTLRDVRWQCPMFAGEPCSTESTDGLRQDVPNYGSNFGNTVDIYAPAHNVESAYSSATNAYRRDLPPPEGWGVDYRLRSGTSFAAPLVAGIAARILQVEQTLTPQQVWDRIRTSAQVVAIPFDTAGVDQNGNPTSNSLLAIRRYQSAACTPEYP